MMARKLLVICGPTATGKTSLGIRLAKKFDGEIISADSRQVYKGLDIGTGKDLPVISNFSRKAGSRCAGQFPISNLRKLGLGCYTLNKIRAWMLDVVRPDQKFNVAKYNQLAWKVIKDIWKRAKLPIMVGGTGFYIKAIVDGLDSLGIEPDWELREKLSNLEIKKLREILEKTCPERLRGMNQSDRQNPRRLIRAIEIALKSQKSKIAPSPKLWSVGDKNQNGNLKLKNKNVLFIGLKAPKEILYAKIDQRVKERVEQGVENEIRKLLDKGYDWENSVLGETIGYQEWQLFFEGKKTKEEVARCWQFAEHAYARRQLTWFMADKRIRWFDISQPGWQKGIEDLIKEWYNSDTFG